MLRPLLGWQRIIQEMQGQQLNNMSAKIEKKAEEMKPR